MSFSVNDTGNLIQPLTIDSDYHEKNFSLISFDKLIFLLHYLIIIPIVMLCFVFLMRFLRSKGIVTSRETDEMIQDFNHIKNIRLIHTPVFNDHDV